VCVCVRVCAHAPVRACASVGRGGEGKGVGGRWTPGRALYWWQCILVKIWRRRQRWRGAKPEGFKRRAATGIRPPLNHHEWPQPPPPLAASAPLPGHAAMQRARAPAGRRPLPNARWCVPIATATAHCTAVCLRPRPTWNLALVRRKGPNCASILSSDPRGTSSITTYSLPDASAAHLGAGGRG
jgi:hypothetical protein